MFYLYNINFMILMYSLLIFIGLSVIFYTLCSFFKLKLIISHATIAIIFSLIITKIIHHSLLEDKNKKIDSVVDELIVGVSPDYPPYAFIQNETISGFDIDLLELIAKKLNLKLKLSPMPFHSILVALQLNKIPMAASGLSGTAERAKHMLISTPYFKNDYLCAVSLKENTIDSIEKLQDKKIIINSGYSSENYLLAMNLNQNLLKLKSVPDALLSLSLKHGDVFITSYASLTQFLKTKEAEKFFIFALPNNNENQEAVSFLINKNNSELLIDVNKIINTFLEDGTIAKLIEKWKLT